MKLDHELLSSTHKNFNKTNEINKLEIINS